MTSTEKGLLALLHTQEETDPMAERILDAALEQFKTFGLRRSTIDDVARRARVGRVTVYRKFENKNGLVGAVLLREARRLFAQFNDAVAGLPTPEDHLVEGFVVAMRYAREHPLIGGLLAIEPETILPLLTLEAGPILAVLREFLVGHLSRAQKAGAMPDFDPAPVAELFVRAAISFLLTPQSVIPTETDEQMRNLARLYLTPVIAGAWPASTASPASRRQSGN